MAIAIAYSLRHPVPNARKDAYMPATARTRPRLDEPANVHAMPPKRDQQLRFEECRAMGHAWRHRPPIGVDDPTDHRRPFGLSTGMVGFPSHCSTCSATRLRWITRSGQVVVRYDHPDGYSRHGDDRLSAGEWRRAYVGHVFADYLQDDAS